MTSEERARAYWKSKQAEEITHQHHKDSGLSTMYEICCMLAFAIISLTEALLVPAPSLLFALLGSICWILLGREAWLRNQIRMIRVRLDAEKKATS